MAAMGSESSVQSAVPPSRRRHVLLSVELVLGLLVLLAAIGIAVTDFAPYRGFWYWVVMVPVFAAASLYTSWSHGRWRGAAGSTVLRTQVLHWLGGFVAVHLVFVLWRAGRMANEAAGLVALLTLALTTFLSGVYGDWRFCLVGVLLGTIVTGAAFVEEFAWMILMPLTVAVVVAVLLWRHSRHLLGAGSEE